MRFPLALKLSVLIASLLLVLGLVMFVTFGVLSRRQIQSTIRSDALSAQKQLNQLIAERRNRLEHLVTFAATGAPRIRELLFTGDAPTVQDQTRPIASELGVDAIEMIDGGGKLLGSTGLAGSPGASEIALLKSSLSSSSATSAVLRRGDSAFIVGVCPVQDAGYVKGSIALFTRIGAHEARDLAGTSGAYVAFLLNGSSVGASFSPVSRLTGLSARPTDLTLNEQETVAVSVPVPGADVKDGLRMVIARPTAGVVKPYQESEAAFAAVLAIALIVSIAAGALFGRGLIKPLGGVVESSRAIQRGEWPAPFTTIRRDEIGLLQSAFNDMTAAARQAQQRLLAMVDLDPLTELSNHRNFKERLSQEASRCKTSGDRMALAILDIDRFGDFNESHGHAKGDELLRSVAEAIRRSVPDYAICARYGGGEFAVLIPGGGADSVREFTETLLHDLGLPVSVSIGIAEYPASTAKPEGLILAAEIALVRAKQLGGAQVCCFDSVPGADTAADPFQLYASIENGSFATIQALAAAVDAKDAYTNGHSERVAKYAAELAQWVGSSPDLVDRVFRAGTLHDVGKIGVPDSILKKPGRLEPEEARIMETHPVLGEAIVAKVPQLKDLLPGVRHHHERWDGAGYPDGLAGEAIPLIARLIALADTYDAMTSDRPYRKGLPVEVALTEISRSSGIQFEPALAEAFVEMMRSSQARVA